MFAVKNAIYHANIKAEIASRSTSAADTVRQQQGESPIRPAHLGGTVFQGAITNNTGVVMGNVSGNNRITGSTVKVILTLIGIRPQLILRVRTTTRATARKQLCQRENNGLEARLVVRVQNTGNLC